MEIKFLLLDSTQPHQVLLLIEDVCLTLIGQAPIDHNHRMLSESNFGLLLWDDGRWFRAAAIPTDELRVLSKKDAEISLIDG